MAINDQFLTKLRCPRGHEKLRLLTPEERDRLNGAVARGEVSTVVGKKVDRPLDDGLVADGQRLVYPVEDGIPILLVDDAIPLP